MPYRSIDAAYCPACRDVALSEGRRFGLHSFRCRQCHGRFLHWDEVQRQLEGRGVRSLKRLFVAVRRGQRQEGERRCPFCAGSLLLCKVGRAPSGTRFDRCKTHGLWFDHNELAAMLEDAVCVTH